MSPTAPRAGIITLYHCYNYGTLLQAWSVRQALRDLSWDAELIGYRTPRDNDWYESYSKWLRTDHPRRNRWAPAFRRKAARIERFIADELVPQGVTPLPELAERSADFDVVVAGSDQLWCQKLGFEGTHFLDFAPDDARTVSYAASFGNTTDVGARAAHIGGLLGRFDALSVRDENSAHLVEELTGRSPSRVLDPSFLVDTTPIETPWTEAPALILYNESWLEPDQEAFIKATAAALGVRIISVGYAHRVADENRIDMDLGEWLGAIRAAAYVVTGLFHGMAVSLKLGKDFTAIPNPDKANKVLDLLTRFDAMDRLDLNAPQIDLRERATPGCDAMVASSLTWLAEAMGGRERTDAPVSG